MCDEGLYILYHESKSVPWVLSIPWVHIYTMTPCVYHELLFIPSVHIDTMSPCLYHKSMWIPWGLFNPMHLFLYHESLPITWVNVYNMSPEIQITKKICCCCKNTTFTNTEIQITRIKKSKLKIYKNTSYINTEIKWQKYRSTNYRNKDMQITEVLAMASATLNSLMFRNGFLLAKRTLC